MVVPIEWAKFMSASVHIKLGIEGAVLLRATRSVFMILLMSQNFSFVYMYSFIIYYIVKMQNIRNFRPSSIKATKC